MGALLIIGTVLWPRALKLWLKIAGFIIVAIIMLVDTIHKTPEEARKRAIDRYVWASADCLDRFSRPMNRFRLLGIVLLWLGIACHGAKNCTVISCGEEQCPARLTLLN